MFHRFFLSCGSSFLSLSSSFPLLLHNPKTTTGPSARLRGSGACRGQVCLHHPSTHLPTYARNLPKLSATHPPTHPLIGKSEASLCSRPTTHPPTPRLPQPETGRRRRGIWCSSTSTWAGLGWKVRVGGWVGGWVGLTAASSPFLSLSLSLFLSLTLPLQQVGWPPACWAGVGEKGAGLGGCFGRRRPMR